MTQPMIYRLRAGKRNSSGNVTDTTVDAVFPADSVAEAIASAKRFELDRYTDDTDYAWLTDQTGATIWDLKLEDAVA